MGGAIPDEVAPALTTAVTSTASIVPPRAKDNRLPSGGCANEEVQRKPHVAWEKREEARKMRRYRRKSTLRSNLMGQAPRPTASQRRGQLFRRVCESARGEKPRITPAVTNT